MKIGILSDTHNHTLNLQKALHIFEQHAVTQLIHCGDFTSVETLQWLCEYPLICAFGNGDSLYGELLDALKGFNPQNRASFAYEGELGGKQIGITHGHLTSQLDSMLHNGHLDYVFCGHTHRRADQRFGRTRLINPGALGGTPRQSRSVCILDSDSESVIFEEIREK